MSLVQELKRRNVIRVGILYLVSSWVLLQFTDVLSSLLDAPEWIGSVVILGLVLGFFPALIFSWVYEMTPDGLRREVDVDRSQSLTPDTGQKINLVIAVLLVIAIGGLVVDRLIPEVADTGDASLSADTALPADDKSIAVLPFADLSASHDQQHFTDGLSEELLNLLVRVDDLRVASRTSSFSYRNSTLGIPEISKALNVGHILEGSVRKDGDRIRITAQLIETSSDSHLWSENFDRELTDIFAIQDEIANAIVQALTGEMGIGGNKAIVVEAATENLDAYEMYLEARELFTAREDIAESIRLYRKAIELDPNFARAWEGLAASEGVANAWIGGDGINHMALAKTAAEKALSLNSELSMPLAVLGLVARYGNGAGEGYDVISAQEYFRAAIEKDPKNTTAFLWQGLSLKAAGFHDEAIVSLQRCVDVDPGYLNCLQHLADGYLQLRQTDKALELHATTMEHVFHSISGVFVSTYVRTGHRLLAVHIADAKLSSAGAPVIEWIRAIENPDGDNSAGYARLKDWERDTTSGVVLETAPSIYLSFKAYDDLLDYPDSATFVIWHADADEFRRTPQFKKLMRKLGIVDYWRARGYPPQCRAVGDNDFECDSPGAN
jgi:adenylate cyclase